MGVNKVSHELFLNFKTLTNCFVTKQVLRASLGSTIPSVKVLKTGRSFENILWHKGGVGWAEKVSIIILTATFTYFEFAF